MDLLARTAELVAIPSVSHSERALADHVESALRSQTALAVTRIGANVVGRTELGTGPPGRAGGSPRHRAGQRQRRSAPGWRHLVGARQRRHERRAWR